jgi:hypothetical protein
MRQYFEGRRLLSILCKRDDSDNCSESQSDSHEAICASTVLQFRYLLKLNG